MPFDRFRFPIGRASASCAMALAAACAVYDDSLLQASQDRGGDVGSGGALLGSGGASSTNAAMGDVVTGDGAPGGGRSGSGNAGAADVDAGLGMGGAGIGGPLGAGGASVGAKGGGSGTAGTGEAGTGGAVSVADAGAEAAAITEELIDDMEDGNDYIPAVDGRRGTWSVGNDATAGGEQMPGNPFVMTLIPSGRVKSMYAAHTWGHGFAGWGAVLLVALNQLSHDPKQSYDASGCLGITFWAKVGPNAATSYKIRIADSDTLPEGKICMGMGCNDHHQSLATWTTTWTKYTYLFVDMSQEGWGTPQKPFDAAHIYDVEFQTSEAKPFDFWIDDLAFVKK